MNSSEEYFYVCEVCLRTFDEGELVPKVLRCGHTFCKSCLAILSESSKKCPKCSRTFPNLKEKNLPVNYSLLSIIRQNRDKKGVDVIMSQTRGLREELSNLSLQMKETLELITFGITQTIELENEILSKNIPDAEPQIEVQTVPKKSSLNISSYSFKDFENSNQFRAKLYTDIKNGKKLFAYAFVNGKVLYGKVSYRDSLILIHSLTLSDIPEDGVVVSFQELKKCITDNKPIKTFFVISHGENEVEQTIIFSIVNSAGGIYFLKLCSGECGASFKGCSYHTAENFFAPDVVTNIVSTQLMSINIGHLREEFLDYEITDHASSSPEPGCLIVSFKNGFKIEKINAIARTTRSVQNHMRLRSFGTTQTHSFVAKVDYPLNLDELISQNNPLSQIVLDCGIAFSTD